MDITSKNLNLLPILVAISDCGGLRQASATLRISQPALSQSLARLRHDFDDPLFVRASHGLIPTPRCEAIVARIRPLLTSIDESYREESLDIAMLQRRMVLACTNYFELRVIDQLVAELRRSAPLVTLRTLSLQGDFPKEQLEKGGVDLAVAAYFESIPSGMRLVSLGSDPIVCIARKDHVFWRSQDALADYLRSEHLSIIVPPDRIQAVDQYLSKKKLKRRVTVELNNFATAPSLLANSNLILTCPESLAKTYASVHKLRFGPVPFSISGVELKMVWHERFQEDKAHIWFRGILRKLVR